MSMLGMLTFALCALGGCGPSFEAIQEGDLRFAHCDRLDLDPNIAASHRLHCWREWRRVYTYGQTRDRVDYAQRRIAEVVSGDSDPSFDLPSGTPEQAAQEVQQRVVAMPPAGGNGTPAPSVSPTAPAPAAPAPLAAPSEQPVPAAAPSCRELCQKEHEACLPGCEARATGCKPCEPSLQACLSKCGSGP